MSTFSVQALRQEFPQLQTKIHGEDLIYFDNGASTLKAKTVIERVRAYDSFEVSNVHRGAHSLSRAGTESYEGARTRVQKFVGARKSSEVIFTRGTTESINLVSHALRDQIRSGDEIVISSFEHHSNIVPWQVLCEKTGAKLRVLPLTRQISDLGKDLKALLNPRTRLVSFLHYSNSFGHRLPVEELVQMCRRQGVLTLVDGAQALLTESLDMESLGCDFYCFSGHKVFAPYGIGVLYGREEILSQLPPFQTGGSMIDRVTFEKTTYADLPQRFEAGTPNISGAVGLAQAVDMVEKWGAQAFHSHVESLRERLWQGLQERAAIETYHFEADRFCGVVSFNLKGAHPTDVGTLLDRYGIAVRAGHHCTQPLMELLKIPGTVRASLAPYNTVEEVDRFLSVLAQVEEFF